MAPAWQEIFWRAPQRSLAVMLGWTAPLPRVDRLITRSGVRFGQQEVDMTITVIGLDLAKNVFQVHGIDENGRAGLCRKIRRSDVLPLFSKLTPALVGMEACHTSHYGRVRSPSLVMMCG